MAEARVALYEGLFLLNQHSVAADFGATVEFMREVFRRAEAEVIVLRKWEERKLAYEIRGQKRGVYLLAYFKARGTQIANIERDCNLSEQVIRCLILRADHVGDIELEVVKKDAELSLEAKLRSPREDAPRPAGEAAPAATPVAAPVAAAPAVAAPVANA
ncbi:MAG: 30S ribosomal protein S6 [Planctomycetota bacterium]|nr:30S ribosomal protein S6 [Planctomycetota bacterium]